jgi:hypothetical protein
MESHRDCRDIVVYTGASAIPETESGHGGVVALNVKDCIDNLGMPPHTYP